MRIIAGEFRSRKLLPPEGQGTRPVTDRVKQSVFDILAPLLPEARVYDCFAGTGSMGLECLSRGAEHVTFFESDRSALARLRRNIGTLGVEGRSGVVASDLFKYFASSAAPQKRADVIFLDPPYRFLTERGDALRELAGRMARDHLSAHGVVVFRHDAADRLELEGLAAAESRTYGGMAVDFLRVETGDKGTGR